MAKYSQERQSQLQDQFMRTARIGKTIETAVDKLIAAGKNKKAPKQMPETSFISGIGYNISAEKAEEIRAKNRFEIENREEIKKAKRMAAAEKKKANKAKADAEAKAEAERLFKAKISRMAKAQIAQREAEAELA